ncbi:hypothetical protein D9613_002123 [Agrocybe pediades]|uniref:FAS1 domain-containing protein n=1 Tax=Agrocybe pediades TaxID=84607 RepID=A0A8H4R3M2_9AGAR|nr:hypothetical protein D9613_002123 [Agrocybe pediades]
MHLPSLPLALLAAALPVFSTFTQSSWSTPSPTSMTLVDALSADPDYSSLLVLLQRSRLIPTLNKLNGSTFFAPTNEAIKRHVQRNSLWRDVLQENASDNVNEQLRQQLLYHLLNETLSALPTEDDVLVYKTLLYPRKPIDPPSRKPPPYPPWMPIPGGTLGGEAQRLRLAAHKDGANIGTDAFGKDGVKIVKGLQDAGNGILLGIDDVLEPPPDLATIVLQNSAVSYFRKIINADVLQRLNATSELTLFLPVDEAWSALDPILRLYLESEFASEELHQILNMHAVADGHVTWSESFKPGLTLETIEGNELDIVNTPEGTRVKDAKLVQPDIYASNGVLHLVSSLLLPPDALKLTPEKYLLALNCSKFVSLLHSVNLTGLINDTDTKYTILAPRDDIMSIFDGPDFPQPGTEELKRLLQYHFLPGKWLPSKLKNGSLLETALEEPGLNGGRQVLSVEVHDEDKKKVSNVRFGGAGTIGDHVEIQNTLVYFISHPLVPPPDVLEAILPDLDLSQFLAGVFSTSKAEKLRTTPATSLLIPGNAAFTRAGLLVSAHLLSPSAKDDLEKVIMHHALDSVQYAHQLINGSQHSFATLEGTDVKVDRLSNGTTYVSASGGWAGMKAEVIPRDLLTQTGVVHELSDLLIPRSVHLTIGKLVKAAKGNTMATLVNKAGFEWVLNGTAPPDGSPWADEKYGDAGWTLLCPTDDAFKKYNLTQLYSDIDNLRTIVSQHLIPMSPSSEDYLDPDRPPLHNDRPLLFEDATYSTLRSPSSAYGDIVFQKKTDTNDYIVGIKGARGTDGEDDSARILSWGRSTTSSGTGGVVQIDRLLLPYQPSIWYEYGAPTAVGVVGILSICAFFYGVRWVWRRDTTEATYEPVGGFGRDDEP